MERQLAAAFAAEGRKIVRAHSYDSDQQHGFI
jgi:hypothetical protein